MNSESDMQGSKLQTVKAHDESAGKDMSVSQWVAFGNPEPDMHDSKLQTMNARDKAAEKEEARLSLIEAGNMLAIESMILAGLAYCLFLAAHLVGWYSALPSSYVHHLKLAAFYGWNFAIAFAVTGAFAAGIALFISRRRAMAALALLMNVAGLAAWQWFIQTMNDSPAR